jgi:hypothetical protein
VESVREVADRQPGVLLDLQEELSKCDLGQIPNMRDILLWKGTASELRSKIRINSALDKIKGVCKTKFNSWLR